MTVIYQGIDYGKLTERFMIGGIDTAFNYALDNHIPWIHHNFGYVYLQIGHLVELRIEDRKRNLKDKITIGDVCPYCNKAFDTNKTWHSTSGRIGYNHYLISYITCDVNLRRTRRDEIPDLLKEWGIH